MGEQEVLNDIRERLVRLETKLDAQSDLAKKVDCIERTGVETEARSKSNTHRIDQLEANLTWLWRTIAGAIIATIVGALVALK
jgi:hypothetical protein